MQRAVGGSFNVAVSTFDPAIRAVANGGNVVLIGSLVTPTPGRRFRRTAHPVPFNGTGARNSRADAVSECTPMGRLMVIVRNHNRIGAIAPVELGIGAVARRVV